GGTPAAHGRRSRRLGGWTRPSAETVHFSASHGSGCSVTRLRRTSGACASRVTRSTAACCALGASRLNVGGSERSDAVRIPPRTGPLTLDEEEGGAPRLHEIARISAPARAGYRICRATVDVIGQRVGWGQRIDFPGLSGG